MARQLLVVHVKNYSTFDFEYVKFLKEIHSQYHDVAFISKNNQITSDKNVFRFNNLSHLLGSSIQNVIIDLIDFNIDYLLAIANTVAKNGNIVLCLRKTNLYDSYIFKKFIDYGFKVNELDLSCNINSSLIFDDVHCLFSKENNVLEEDNLSLPKKNTIFSNEQLEFFIEVFNSLSTLIKEFDVENNKLLLSKLAIFLSCKTDSLQKIFSKIKNKKTLSYNKNTEISKFENIYDKDNNNKIFLLTGKRGSGKTFIVGKLCHFLCSYNLKIGLLNCGSKQLNSIYNLFEEDSLEKITLENFKSFCKKIDLLIIEEGAAIPLKKLNDVISLYKIVIIVSTMEGYEGSAKGLDINLNRHNLLKFTFNESFRFQETDNLARLLSDICFDDNYNNAECRYPSNEVVLDTNPNIQIIFCDKASLLLLDIDKLYKINHLLRNNHYEQTFQDLIRWITSDSFIAIAEDSYTKDVVGVCVFSCEQIVDELLARCVYEGTRLPKGNLIPQTLLAHHGLEQASKYKYIRIERIAVDNQYRRQKIASKLINMVEIKARDLSVDILGVSFALKIDVYKFWRKQLFGSVGISLTHDNASGYRSLLMLKDLLGNQDCIDFINNASLLFYLKNIYSNCLIPIDINANKHLEVELNNNYVDCIKKYITKDCSSGTSNDEKSVTVDIENFGKQILFHNIQLSKNNIDLKQVIELLKLSMNLYLNNSFIKVHVDNLIKVISCSKHSVEHAKLEILIFLFYRFIIGKLNLNSKSVLNFQVFFLGNNLDTEYCKILSNSTNYIKELMSNRKSLHNNIRIFLRNELENN